MTGHVALVLPMLLAFAAPGAVPPVVGSDARPAPRSAEIDDTLEIGGEELAARQKRNRMTVEVHVNEAGPYRFIVDSGADSSVVSRRLATALDLPKGKPAMLSSITDISAVDRVLVDSMKIGPTVVEELELPVLEEAHLGSDGLIGLDALVGQRLMLDFDRKVISVDDGRTAPRYVAGEIIVTGRLRRSQLILTEVSAGAVKLQAIVDTGSEVTIGNLALRDQLVRRNRAKLDVVKVYGVTGTPLDVEMAIVPRIKIGRIVMENVPIAFADIPPFGLFGLTEQPGLLLGTDVMALFRRVSLDFHARKVRFQLRECERTRTPVEIAATPSRLQPGGKLCQD